MLRKVAALVILSFPSVDFYIIFCGYVDHYFFPMVLISRTFCIITTKWEWDEQSQAKHNLIQTFYLCQKLCLKIFELYFVPSNVLIP